MQMWNKVQQQDTYISAAFAFTIYSLCVDIRGPRMRLMASSTRKNIGALCVPDLHLILHRSIANLEFHFITLVKTPY